MASVENRTINNRYELLDKLGEGGMGAVYRATDRLTGQTIALKQVTALTENRSFNTSSDSLDFRLALAQEFKVLASLRHPHIISVLDYGFDDQRQPYVTMELLENANLFLYAGEERDLDYQVDLLIHLLQALAYLHRRGILHRDLKPGNVLVTGGDQVKVLDFGLAVEPEQAKEVAGTLAYMAPEILSGENASPASDMYAVGVMAYELLAGQHPFSGSNPTQLLINILRVQPDLTPLRSISISKSKLFRSAEAPTIPRATRPLMDEDSEKTSIVSPLTNQETAILGSELPEDLEKTVSALPDALLTDSDKTVIGAPLADKQPTETETPDPNRTEYDPGNIATDYQKINTAEFEVVFGEEYKLSKPSLEGIVKKLLAKNPKERYRDAYAVIAELCEALGRPIPEESQAIRESFLQAAKFVGREQELETLEIALKAALNRNGSAWLIAGESGVGKSRLLDELRALALVQGVTVMRGQATAEGGLPFHLWRELLRRLVLTTQVSDLDAGILKDLVPDIENLMRRTIPDVMALEGTAYQQRLMGTIASLFQRQEQPLLLLFEDLQWASESLDLLRLLNGMVGDLPILIVGSFRSEDHPNLPDELPGMQVLRLERLSPQSIEALSVSMLGEAGRQAQIIELLQKETEGNVFFLVEVVRALAEEAGRLENIGRTALPQAVFSGGVQTVLKRRLERVPEEYRDLIELAAIAGREIDLNILKHVTGDIKLDDWLTICANSAVIEVQEGQWRFAHDKLRQTALENIPDELEPDLHRQIAEAIETAYPDAPEQASTLAQHWHSAGNIFKERIYAQRAGEHALLISAFSDAITFLQRALELLPETVEDKLERDKTQADILIMLGETLKYTGDYETAKQHFETALELRAAEDTAGRAEVLLELGDLLTLQGEYAKAAAFCEEGLALYEALDIDSGKARALDRLGMIHFQQGTFDEAVRLCEDSLELSRAHADQQGIASAINNLGIVAYARGDYAAAYRYFEETLDICRASGERRKAATALLNLGSAAGEQGDYEAAIRCFEETLAICREIGERRGVALSLDNLGVISEFQQQYEKATNYYEQSLEIAYAIGNRRGSATTLVNLGNVARAQDQKERAATLYHDALQQAYEIEAYPTIMEILTGLAGIEANTDQALDLLGLVLNHPATFEATRKLVNPILETLQETLPQDVIDAGLARGGTLDLDQVIGDILA